MLASPCWCHRSSDRHGHLRPALLPGFLPGLRSRLTAGLTVPLAPPQYATRTKVLRELAELRGIPLSEAVVDILAQNMRATVPELFGALVQLEMAAQSGRLSHRCPLGAAVRQGPPKNALTAVARDRPVDGPPFFAQPPRPEEHFAPTGSGPSSRGRHVSGPLAHPMQPCGDRPLLRRSRPHNRFIRLSQDRGIAAARACHPRRRAPAPTAIPLNRIRKATWGKDVDGRQ